MGDPRQLEAQSEFKLTHLPATQGGVREFMAHHARSTMERLTSGSAAAFRAGGACTSLLRTQYRMHDAVCSTVSRLFYNSHARRVWMKATRTHANKPVSSDTTGQTSRGATCRAPKQRALLSNEDAAVQRREVMLPRDASGAAAQLVCVYTPSSDHGRTTAHATGYSNSAEAFVALFVRSSCSLLPLAPPNLPPKTSNPPQKAKEAFWYLHRTAKALRWTPEQRRAAFHGPAQTAATVDGATIEAGAWPRVFVLTQYARQVRLLQALLRADAEVTPDISNCFVVRARRSTQTQWDESHLPSTPLAHAGADD